ncbi:Brf1p family coiled coil protein [Cardiosporidium cionae]|uniref:Brf1p family coiled coil protein n=1 Tax=Cardiosporidium cionae TaxID=476202 RepID=A0ABQ7JE94_9APIC|nr:Brf1p family coiled coil protein [Cardiosporidium cionae]|eukprot:KAF8822225.1 Brf1p family coiled coil protein [Cardiosporidium cionae]
MEKPNRRGRDFSKPTLFRGPPVPGLPKPDENAYLIKITEEKKCIKELREKLDAVFQKLKIANEQKEKSYNEFVVRMDTVTSIQSRVDTLISEKATIYETLESKQREKKQNEVNSRKTVRARSNSDIDLEIAKIEKEMMISTMSLKQEKQLMAKIETLKGMKSRVTKPSPGGPLKSNAVDNEEMQITQLKTSLEKIEAELATLRATRTKEYNQMQPRSSRETDQQAITDLYEQRNTLKQQMKEHALKRDELFHDWTALVKNYNDAAYQEQRRRNEKLRDDRAKKNAEMQRFTLQQKLEEAEELPVTNEYLLLEQLVKYVQKLIDEKNSRESLNGHIKNEDKAAPAMEEMTQGVEAINKKTPAASTKKGASAKKEKAKVLRYDLQTLTYFDQCGVEAPLKEEQLGDCLLDLQQKLAQQKELQLVKIEEMDEQKKSLRAQLSALDNPPLPSSAPKEEVVNPPEVTTSEA